MRAAAMLIASFVGFPVLACAQAVDEVRLGALAHNICVVDCDNADKEDGPNISGEIVFATPDILKVIGKPRPYLVASVNTQGNTSFGAAGLHWNWDFAEGWSLEPGFGYAIHTGEETFPFPQGDPRNDPVSAKTIYFGSRDLFRSSLALSRDLAGPWGVQIMYEHLSHGQIIGSGRNQGLDNIGVRVSYAFGEQ